MQKTKYFAPGVRRVWVSCVCKEDHKHSSRNKSLVRFLGSFVVLPVLTVAMPLGGLVGVINNDVQIPAGIALTQQNTEAHGQLAFNQLMDQKAKEAKEAREKAEMLERQAKAIDAYFKARNMPLQGMGKKMAEVAEKHDLDWRLIPSIAVVETTGGKFACPDTYKRTGDKKYIYNAFGWGSCKITFDSYDDAIETIGRNLAGKNPNTKHHYSGKSTEEILKKYNPPSIKPSYVKDVMGVMEVIGDENLGTVEVAANS